MRGDDPRSPAARILADCGITAAELARRAGVTRQVVSWHLSGGSAGLPPWLVEWIRFEAGRRLKDGDSVVAQVEAACDRARASRRTA